MSGIFSLRLTTWSFVAKTSVYLCLPPCLFGAIRVIWVAVSWAWSLKKVHWIKHNSQLIGCAFFFFPRQHPQISSQLRVKPKCLESPVKSPLATILTTPHSTLVTLTSFHFLKHFTNSHIKTFVHVLLSAWDALHLDFQRVCSGTPASGLSTHHLLSEICCTPCWKP